MRFLRPRRFQENRPKESVMAGLCLTGLGVAVVLAFHVVDSLFSIREIPWYVLGLVAIGYAAIFVGVVIFIVAVASRLFGTGRRSG
jgi:hypothetical protein